MMFCLVLIFPTSLPLSILFCFQFHALIRKKKKRGGKSAFIILATFMLLSLRNSQRFITTSSGQSIMSQ